MGETVLTIGYRLIGDLIVSDVACDETVEKLVSNPSSGEESNIFEDFERKNRDSSYFPHFGDRLER